MSISRSRCPVPSLFSRRSVMLDAGHYFALFFFIHDRMTFTIHHEPTNQIPRPSPATTAGHAQRGHPLRLTLQLSCPDRNYKWAEKGVAEDWIGDNPAIPTASRLGWLGPHLSAPRLPSSVSRAIAETPVRPIGVHRLDELFPRRNRAF